jgi:hypothetical protein
MPIRSAIVVALFATVASAPARAAPGDFACRNASAQISCTGEACAVETGSFTPMAVSRTGDNLEVCAYSGCGEGALDLIHTRGALTFLHAVLTGGPVNGPAAVVFDREQKIATLLWGSFAQPLNCSWKQ